jgi:aryl-alcohol dehydrogenase-like predicted oxidoreductase
MEDKYNNRKSGLSRRDFATRSIMGLTGLTLGSNAIAQSSTGRLQQSATDTLLNAGRRKLGSLEVSPIGLGCMSMKDSNYNPPRSKDEMIPVIRGAVERGVTLFDTAEIYGPFTDEELVGEALAPVRNQVVICTKFGFDIQDGKWSIDRRSSKPNDIRRAVEGSLKRLRTDRIDLLYQHRVDPNIPIEDVAGTVKELIHEGKVLHFGLSEASPKTIRRAHAVHPVDALQSQYSLIERVHENGALNTCEELGIGFVAYGPMGRALLSDHFNEWSRFAKEDRRSSVAFFEPDALLTNMRLLTLIRAWAIKKDATPAQISLAWLLAQKSFIVPIPGTTKLHHVKENQGAVTIKFSDDELKEFREALEEIKLVGVRSPNSALTDE